MSAPSIEFPRARREQPRGDLATEERGQRSEKAAADALIVVHADRRAQRAGSTEQTVSFQVGAHAGAERATLIGQGGGLHR